MSATALLPAAQSLAVALVDDPFYQAITIASGDDRASRLARLTRYFESSMLEGQAIGRVDVAGADGAAIWITSHDQDRHQTARAHKLAAFHQCLGRDGLARYHAMVRNMETCLPAGLDEAWYLSIIGVSPDRRGQGLGRRLLAPALARADSLATQCYLETFNPRSLPFYVRLGFTVVRSRVEPLTGAPYQIMLREPKKAVLAA